jgi:serine/threonine protein kinase
MSYKKARSLFLSAFKTQKIVSMMLESSDFKSSFNFKSRVSLVQSIRAEAEFVVKNLFVRFKEGGYAPATPSPTQPGAVMSWDDTVIIQHVVPSSRPEESDAVVFKASFLGNGCFGKLIWRNVTKPGGANTERLLMQEELETVARRTPCIPLRFVTVEIPRDIFNQTEMYKTTKSFMKGRRASRKHVHVMLIENCGELPLSAFLKQNQRSEEIHSIYFMLYHALAFLSEKGVSHNDLHSNNIMITDVEPSLVCFGDKQFFATCVPRIIDWDLGRAVSCTNKALREYNHVGIFDSHNSLFDLFGLTKTLFWHHEKKDYHRMAACSVIQSTDARRLVQSLRDVFKTVDAVHPWVLQYEKPTTSGKRLRCVQQTPFIPNKDDCVAVEKWPSDIYDLTPTYECITGAIYASMNEKMKTKQFRDYLFPAVPQMKHQNKELAQEEKIKTKKRKFDEC